MSVRPAKTQIRLSPSFFHADSEESDHQQHNTVMALAAWNPHDNSSTT